ncbi:hypothetical protein [Streptomyces sp. CA-253872]|uniref:hypothetical protein n=1 Tax=Streptomyces sp. CA-253872 TaxID=3240067 RepID=UPI003D933312
MVSGKGEGGDRREAPVVGEEEPRTRATTDPAHGGRWTSLRAGGREWLWHREEPRRAGVRPGDAFADAGGLEECLPTIRGLPDHGDVWSRAWRRSAGEESVATADFRLSRRLAPGPDPRVLVAHYRLTAAPGYSFLWAAHALLDLSADARIVLPAGAPLRLYPDGGDRWLPGEWPTAQGHRVDRLGPDDGTAVGAVVEVPDVVVRDGPHALRLRVEAEGQPVSVALWRNLGGFPEEAPYRSVGVEPMLGRVFDLAAAGAHESARVPESGEVRWRLTVEAAADET